ncbi:MAG: TetR/AcrR family transcriptional regulator [Oscillospiraceae bacterium]|nr:TetR/AcrR family transcriptional regulator [Oscillospiraceae bacterium]
MAEQENVTPAETTAAPAPEKKERPKSDLRKQKTRKALETAFFELSETKWIEDITVGDICEKAMVRRATFYKHFADKYEFFAYVMNNIQRSTNLQQNAPPQDITMAEYCLNICRSYLRNYQEHPKMVRRLLNSKSRQPYTDILVAQIRNAILRKANDDRSKGIETEIDVNVLAGFIGGAIPTAMTIYETNRIPGLSVEEYFDQLRMIFERICVTRPIQSDQN